MVAQVEQAPIDTAGGATNESMDVDKGNEEVEVEAVWEVEEEDSTQAEELDPRTLGVPGLETLVPGDLVEVLWANGALSPRPCPAPQRRPQAPELHHVRAGWERGRVKECVLELRAGRPVILYRITYDDGEKVSSHTLTSTHSRATAGLRGAHRWQKTCARSRLGRFMRRPRRTCSAFSSAGAC